MQSDLLTEASTGAVTQQSIADIGAGVLSFLALSTVWMDWLDVVIKVIVGLLTIALLVQRLMAHRRKKDQ